MSLLFYCKKGSEFVANELERSKRIVIGEEFEKEINQQNLKYFKQYKRDMEIRGLSPTTIYGYERDLMQWMSYLVREQFNPVITEVTDEDLEEFVYYCKEEGNNASRLQRRMAPISEIFKFLRKKKIIKENPMEFLSRPKKGLPIVVQTFLTQQQVDLVREKLLEFDDLQLTTYVELSLSTMARKTAISNISWEQIDFDNMMINDVLEKEGKIVTLYMNEKTRDLLLQLKAEREENNVDNKYVFITKYKGEYNKVDGNTLTSWTKKIGNAIGVPTLHCHDWRHSGATLKKNMGMKLEDVSSLLNHAGTDVTKKFYIKEDKTKMGEMARKFDI